MCEFIVEAEKCAAALDSWSSEKRQNALLFGLPCSIKESVAVQGALLAAMHLYSHSRY